MTNSDRVVLYLGPAIGFNALYRIDGSMLNIIMGTMFTVFSVWYLIKSFRGKDDKELE